MLQVDYQLVFIFLIILHVSTAYSLFMTALLILVFSLL